MKINKYLLGVLSLIILGIFILAFSKNMLFQKTSLSSKPKVAATIFPLYDILKNIAGEEIEVVLLLPPGASPHTYDPTPQEVKKLAGSQALFTIGHGLDDWSKTITKSAEVKKTISVDKNIVLLDGDPHYWLSLPNAALIAEQIKEELATLFPEKQSKLEKNFQAYTLKLDNLAKEINAQFENLPVKKIATFHSAWAYFSRDHAINVVATFEEFPGKEPTAEYLSEFQAEIKKSGVTAIFSEPQFSTQPLEAIAKDLGVTISVLDPLGGGKGRESYESLIRYNVNQIVKALQ